jgi:catabolite regulation protein CreA
MWRGGSDILGDTLTGLAAGGLVSAGRGIVRGLAGTGVREVTAATTVEVVEQQALARTITISEHAAEAMENHQVTEAMVKKAIQVGQRFYDPKNKSIVYVVKEGMASGKDLAVATTETGPTTVVKTVMVNVETIRPRFVPLPRN